MRALRIAALLLVLAGPAARGQSKVGTTAANFLAIPVGPRASAMGGAFVAVADDATDLYWNPAGLSRLGMHEFSASHAGWIAGTGVNWFGLALRLDEHNALGVSVSQLDYGEEEITTADQPNGTGQTWDAQDLAIGVSYARDLTDHFSVGGTVKFIHERIYNESASAFAADVGLLFTTPYHGITIGMSIANFGTEMQLDGKDLYQAADIDPGHAGNNSTIISSLGTRSWALPLVFKVGLAAAPFEMDDLRWVVATDAVYASSQSPYMNAGTEVTWRNLLSLRAGYGSLFKEASEEGMTAGAGVRLDLGGVLTRVDYSYGRFGVFDGVSRFSLTVGF
jgi:hypothetical protein